MKRFTIKKLEANQRLDIFLTKKLALSRAKIQKLIKDGLILVNNKNKSAHYKIQEDDEIIIKKTKKQKNKKTILEKLPQFKIVTETNDYFVINKPAGVVVHGGENIEGPTLVDALKQKYPEIKKVGEDSLRPGIVHRLDKEASGLLVVAKNNKMFEHLKKQFQKRQIQKKYIALVYGKTDKKEDKINFPISRSAKGYKMAAHSRTQGGRNAVTEFEVIKHFINYTLLKVKIKTGRTHQIRVHLSAYGHPVVGDDLYGTRKTRERNTKLRLGRIFLHADKLGFYDLDGKWKEFKIKLPSELEKILKGIK